MRPSAVADIVRFAPEARPRLIVIVDAEEEFDWGAPFSRAHTNVRSIAAQFRAQRLYQQFGVVPTYAVDYPVAAQAESRQPLLELLQSGACQIGAQLHPWVNPPFEEEVTEANSFPGNLLPDLERRKLAALTTLVEQGFGVRPTLYRAGRYGIGPNTLGILLELGYRIDCSVLPAAPTPGPTPRGLRHGTAHPYWLGQRRLLEIPVTLGLVGAARGVGSQLYRAVSSPLARRLKLPAVLARLRILDRIRLSPEGSTLDESKRLTRAMLADGHRLFAISYHSPSLAPGNTPYVRNQGDLARFLGWLEGYLEFFLGEVAGAPATPDEILDWARTQGGGVPG